MAQKWEFIGHKLGLGSKVMTLRMSDQPAESKCLSMLAEWVQSGREVSWQQLLKVLTNSGILLYTVASKIKQHLLDNASWQLTMFIHSTSFSFTLCICMPFCFIYYMIIKQEVWSIPHFLCVLYSASHKQVSTFLFTLHLMAMKFDPQSPLHWSSFMMCIIIFQDQLSSKFYCTV